MTKNTPLLIAVIFIMILPMVVFTQDVILPVDKETGLITYRDVIPEEGNQESFFNSAISWINGYYANPVDVTKTRNPESGLIKGMHRIKLKDTDADDFQTDAGTVQYCFTLEFKEGRYRYTLTEFSLRHASKIPAEKWLNKTDLQSKSYLKQIDDFAQSWIGSLKMGMKPKAEKKEDEW